MATGAPRQRTPPVPSLVAATARTPVRPWPAPRPPWPSTAPRLRPAGLTLRTPIQPNHRQVTAMSASSPAGRRPESTVAVSTANCGAGTPPAAPDPRPTCAAAICVCGSIRPTAGTGPQPTQWAPHGQPTNRTGGAGCPACFAQGRHPPEVNRGERPRNACPRSVENRCCGQCRDDTKDWRPPAPQGPTSGCAAGQRGKEWNATTGPWRLPLQGMPPAVSPRIRRPTPEQGPAKVSNGKRRDKEVPTTTRKRPSNP